MKLFEKTHPNIKLVFVDWYWQADKFAADLDAGRAPDAMTIPATEGDLLIGKGQVIDLAPLMKEKGVGQDFNDLILTPYKREGRLYAIPANIYVMGLFYDKKLFRDAGLVNNSGEPAPPTTWDELVTSAQAIKQKTGAAGFCMLSKSNQGGWTFVNLGWQAGGEFERRVGDKWQAAFAEPPIVAAMQFVKDLRWKHNVLSTELLLDGGATFPMLAKHECGMAIYPPEWFEYVLQTGGTLEDLGLTGLPAGPGGRANLMGGSYRAINSRAKPAAQQAAMEWIIWQSFSLDALELEITTPARAGVRVPWSIAIRSLMYKPDSEQARKERELLDKYRNVPYFKTYVEQVGQYARPEPFVAPQELYAALDGVIQAVLKDEKADPQALLTQAAQDFQTKYLDAAK
jgi:ABC-type glycerol-3-phosphate transport system substrate-binding protein